MAKDAEFSSNGNGGDDKTVEKLPFRKSSGPTKYLTSLRSNADSALFEKR